MRNSSPSHSLSIFSSVLNSEYSFDALDPIVSTCSMWSMILKSMRSWMLNSRSWWYGRSSTLKICSQWRLPSAGFASSCKSGRYCLKSSTSSR